jgi:hypothetical protein
MSDNDNNKRNISQRTANALSPSQGTPADTSEAQTPVQTGSTPASAINSPWTGQSQGRMEQLMQSPGNARHGLQGIFGSPMQMGRNTVELMPDVSGYTDRTGRFSSWTGEASNAQQDPSQLNMGENPWADVFMNNQNASSTPIMSRQASSSSSAAASAAAQTLAQPPQSAALPPAPGENKSSPTGSDSSNDTVVLQHNYIISQKDEEIKRKRAIKLRADANAAKLVADAAKLDADAAQADVEIAMAE